MKKIIFCLISLLLILKVNAQEIPQKISYQGRLLENNELVSGSKSISFTIGTWTETHSSVEVVEGVYTVTLGEITPIPTNVFDNSSNVNLQISIAGTNLNPQTEILSVPYAFKAKKSVDTDNIAGNPVSGTPGNNQVLKWNGTQWTPADETGGILTIPAGVIVMWSGTLAAIPMGWALCDGANGTPNLTDRFVYSVSAGENPGSTGGENTYTLTISQLPSHPHSFSTNPVSNHTHSFSTSTDGSHTHDLYASDMGYGGGDWWTGIKSSSSSQSGLMSSAGSHSHSGTTNSSGFHLHSGTTDNTGSGSSIDNRPAYYKLAFIMKL